MDKKIIIINGSPRAHGNTETLVDAFLKGAQEAGNTVQKFNTRQMQIHHCNGCYGCKTGQGAPCVLADDMNSIYDAWKDADIVVFASPLYWMQFTSLFKTVIDRLFAIATFSTQKKDAILILSAATEADRIRNDFPMVQTYYEYLLSVLGFRDAGRIIAGGLHQRSDCSNTSYLQEAYDLGKSL